MKLNRTSRPYVAIWLAVAIFMGLSLGIAEHRRNQFDDPDQAWQRSGLLLPGQSYRAPIPGVAAGRPAIVFFARSLSHQHLFHDLADQADLAGIADLVVVTFDGSRPVVEHGIRQFVVDTDGSLSNEVELHRPIDGGYPVGYVLIDSQGFVRFRTLDPEFEKRAWEIKLLLRHIQ